MGKTIIEKIHLEFKEKKRFTLPEHLVAPEQGYMIRDWIRELATYYREESIIVRPFDELPPLKLSQQDGIETAVQDIHKFIISDLNLIPMDIRKKIFQELADKPSPTEAWEAVTALLLDQLQKLDAGTVKEEMTWKFSPIAEILWALTWVFMEQEGVTPPKTIRMVTSRFPYYVWLSGDGKPAFWEPESPWCRWEWLALDLYTAWQKSCSGK